MSSSLALDSHVKPCLFSRIAMLSEDYRERSEIEIESRCVKAATGKMRSRSVPVRLITVFFAMMLYNFWAIAKFTESGGEGTPPSGPCT